MRARNRMQEKRGMKSRGSDVACESGIVKMEKINGLCFILGFFLFFILFFKNQSIKINVVISFSISSL